ncbi:ASTRA-associated protein 1 [Diplogelasinospora grovesii]|uniref:ASTRA-associated protein 1 n=1 Tax=Diplogelasinospora grovesii TaxID=303347 RepID=A0AAN6S068_9PEZI|nr:ASTRA-associated protein 1 [Diplogelasinospora grovesii]
MSHGMAAEGRPAQPKSILRGHKAQVHAAAFIRDNERLLTGDADGFVIAWDLTIMRPRAVWQAHIKAILGIAGWDKDRVITHGRDNKLIVWKLTADDEASLSTTLPLDPSPEPRPQPWILHLLEVNTMNFCSFSFCPAPPDPNSTTSSDEVSVAVPNTLASEAIDIFHLPSQSRLHTVRLGRGEQNGMVMALSLFHHSQSQTLALVAGYENGQAIMAHISADGSCATRYQNKAHSQPILSLDVSPARDFFLTSSADALIIKHPLPSPTLSDAQQEVLQTPLKTINTKHSGQQSLRIRSDGKIFATAGWDSKVRLYSTKTLKEVAVLKWHQVGCYATAFAILPDNEGGEKESNTATPQEQQAETQTEGTGSEVATVPKLVEMTVRDKRITQAKTAHWLAAGSKDGKVSLWDVF